MWPEFKHRGAWPSTVSTFVDSGSLFCLLSLVALNDPLFADNPLVVLRESRQSLAPPLSLIWANKSRLLRTEFCADNGLIKAPFVVKFHRSGLGIIFD